MVYVIGLDIGTTSTIGILIELPARVVGLASRPVTLSSPHHGWAEEDPLQWWENAQAITRELLAIESTDPANVGAVGVTGMLPAVVLLDEAGSLLRPSIQQSDGRSGREVEAMRKERDEAAFIKKAGNGINQQLVTAKLRWLEKHEPEVFSRIATVFGSYDFVNFKLTGKRAVEQNWALEAGFVDVSRGELDEDLIAWAHLPAGAIPPKIASHEVLGGLTEEAAALTGLRAGTPVVGGAADMVASAFGAGVQDAGDVLLKFGGAVDILTATDKARPDPRLFLDYHLIPGLYMPNGCMSTGGSALNWFIATFAGQERLAAQAEGISVYRYLDRLAENRPAGAEGVVILPYLLGEKTPIHDPDARGVISGLTLSHDIGHLWRALLESYAYALRHHIDVLNDIGLATTRFLVSDGGAQSTVWMQTVADVLQRPVHCLTGHPGSCLGVAWTAAMGAGLADDWAGVSAFVGRGPTIAPSAANKAVYDDAYARFRGLYRPQS